MPKKRNTNRRKVKDRILILCEGKKTEPYYFNGLKSDVRNRSKLSALRVEIYDSGKNTAKELVLEAEELKKIAESENNPYDDVWVVFDKDGYTKHPESFNLAEGKNINIIFSSISFEYWFLLHFEFTSRAYEKSDDLIKYLSSKYIKNYEKNDDNYNKLKTNTAVAIQNAKKIRKHWKVDIANGEKIYNLNPYTDVDTLVEKLIKL